MYWRGILRFQASDRHEDAVEQGVRIGWTAGNININRNHRVHAPASGVVLAKDSTATPARAYGHDQARIGRCIVGFSECQFHVTRDRAGYQQHVGMARGGDEVNTEAFDVIDRAVEVYDFDFAPVARTGIYLADVKRAAEEFVRALPDLLAEEVKRCDLRRRQVAGIGLGKKR